MRNRPVRHSHAALRNAANDKAPKITMSQTTSMTPNPLATPRGNQTLGMADVDLKQPRSGADMNTGNLRPAAKGTTDPLTPERIAALYPRLEVPGTGRAAYQLTSGPDFCQALYYFIPSLSP